MKAVEFVKHYGKLSYGITFYPYQFTLGISLRYWPCLYMTSIRIHLLCFKLWIGVVFEKHQEGE